MDVSQKLNQSIKELQRLTGLPIELHITEEQDANEILRQIRALSSAYKDANSKEIVVNKWLSGEMSDTDFFHFADRMHIAREENRGVYLIQLKNDLYPEVTTFLKNIFSDSKSMIVPVKRNQLLVIYRFKKSKVTSEIMEEKAYEILDNLNAELMEHAVIGYSSSIISLDQIPEAYRHACMALQIGSVFYPDKTVYCYADLGVGSILYNVPEDICRSYIIHNLGKQFLEHDSAIFHSDIFQTANCFLNNNLNIAETARQLHIHRNTLLYRLEQIQNESGLDIRRFDAAVTYKLSAMILLYLKTIS